MKNSLLTRSARLLPLALIATLASAVEPQQQPNWGVRDLPRLATPNGAVDIARDEIRDEVRNFRRDLRGLRDGEPSALVHVAFTGAQLAGADGGSLMLARIAYQVVHPEPGIASQSLHEAIPARAAQLPDTFFRHAVRATLLHGFSADLGGVVAGDLRGQAEQLAPAALRSIKLAPPANTPATLNATKGS